MKTSRPTSGHLWTFHVDFQLGKARVQLETEVSSVPGAPTL